MATKQAIASSTEQLVVKESQSMTLVKNMLRVSLSQICYLRRIFPESCFAPQDYAGLSVHQLDCAEKAESGELVVKHEEAFMLTQWLERGVFDAFEKRYLKTLIFAIYTTNPDGSDNILESYQFGIEYPDSESTTINNVALTKDNLKQQAIKFIRCLVEFSQTIDDLPEERWITMKLLYYDDITPPKYEPEFFHSSSADNLTFQATNPLKIKIGSVQTPHHRMQLKFVGLDSLFDDEAASSVAAPQPRTNSAPAATFKDHRGSSSSSSSSSNQPEASLVQNMEQLSVQSDNSDEQVIQRMKALLSGARRTSIKECARKLNLDERTAKRCMHKLADRGFLKKMGFWFQVLGSRNASAASCPSEDDDGHQSEGETEEQSADDARDHRPSVQFITPVDDIEESQQHLPEPPPVVRKSLRGQCDLSDVKLSQPLPKGRLEFTKPAIKKRELPSDASVTFSQDLTGPGAKCSIVQEPIFQSKRLRRG